MRRGKFRLAIAAALALPAVCGAASPVQAVNRAQIQALLSAETPCSVIDARSERERSKLGIAHTLLYRDGMELNPAGWVIVIADTDERAMQVGDVLAKATAARNVAAVKGGAKTWLDAQQAVQGGPSGLVSFIIPRNTCEQGPALQILPAKRP